VGGHEENEPVIAVLLDDDADLLEAIAELLEMSHCRCLLAHSVDELKQLGPKALEADVALLDINLGAGKPSGIDAYDWLLAQGFAGRLFFFTGHAQGDPMVARAARRKRASVLVKPMDAGTLLDRILGGTRTTGRAEVT
jgi:FixJ family two-component response regulator